MQFALLFCVWNTVIKNQQGRLLKRWCVDSRETEVSVVGRLADVFDRPTLAVALLSLLSDCANIRRHTLQICEGW